MLVAQEDQDLAIIARKVIIGNQIVLISRNHRRNILDQELDLEMEMRIEVGAAKLRRQKRRQRL